MKKKLLNGGGLQCYLRKLLLVMKLTILLIFLGLMSVSASIYSQATKLTMTLHGVTIAEVFKQIEAQSEFVFIYKNEVIDLSKKVDVSAEESTVERILDELFKGSGLKYEILKKQIIITPDRSVKAITKELLEKPVEQPQKKNLQGKVTDKNGDPVPGCTVLIKGTTIGVLTDSDGSFNFDVPLDAKILSISFVGMKSQELPIGSKTNFSVLLEEETIGVEEVVVVGYGIQKKETVVGSISQIQSKEILSTGVRTVTNALSGLVPGLVTQQNSGQPGKDAATIFIRGRSSWQNSAPLILVDGIERSMTDIDPNEIESISVLKDASATAVYGTRGGNGVIIITTKRGSEYAPQMSFTYNQGVKTPTGRNTYVDSYNTMLYANEAMRNDNNWAGLIPRTDLEHYRTQDMPLFYPSVDWSGEMVKKIGYETDMNYNVSGGIKKLKYFASFGYMHDGDVLNTDKVGDFDARFYSNRYNIRTNFDYLAGKSTLVSLNFGGSIKSINQPTTNLVSLWRGIYSLPPSDSPVIYDADVLAQYPDVNEPNASGPRYAWGSGKYGSMMSPITAVFAGGSGGAGFSKQNNNELSIDFKIKQDLDAIAMGLSVSGIVSYNLSAQYSDTYAASVPRYRLLPDGTWQRNPEYGGDTDVLTPLNYSGTSFNSNIQRLYYEARVNYARKFGMNDLSLMGIVKRSKRDVISGSTVSESYKDEDWAGRITYNYDLRYLFEANLSLSGSEQFAPGNRFGFFPAFAVGWNMAEEKFIKNSSLAFINKLKTRATWGKTGTTAGARWLYYPAAWSSAGASNFGGLGGSTATWNYAGASYNEGAIENAEAQWEESTKKNLGFELGLFKNLLTFNIDFFDETRDNILMPPTFLVPSWGAFSGKDRNIGETENHGYEVELLFNKRLKNNFSFYVGGNMSFNENRIIFRGDPAATQFYQKLQGHPIDAVRDMLANGLYQSVDDINNYIAPSVAVQRIPGDLKYVDYNADGKIDANDSAPIENQTYPAYDYVAKGGFQYKNLSVSVLVQANQGKVITMYGHFTPFGVTATGLPRIEAYQFDHYTPETPNSTGYAYHFSGDVIKNNNFFGNSAYDAKRTVPSDYIRLKQLEIAYTIKNDFLKDLHVNNVLLYFNGNNLLTFSPLKQKFVDPEKPLFLAGQGQYDYPMARRFNVGLKLNF